MTTRRDDRSEATPPDTSAWSGVELDGRLAEGHRSEVWSGRSPLGPVAVRRSRRSASSLLWELELLVRLDRDGLVVPAPMPTAAGGLSHHGVVVQRWIDGRKPSSEADWIAVGEELRRLHESTIDVTQRPDARCVVDLDATGRSIDAEMAELPDDVRATVLDVFAGFTDVPRAVIHGDPGPDNVRITPNGHVALLDWDESRVDLTWHDLSNLGVQVLADRDHERAQVLSDAWETINAWATEPAYARRRLASLRTRLG